MRHLLPLLTVVAGCSVGEVPLNGGGADGGGGGDGSLAAVCRDRSATPSLAYEHGGAGTHAGENCIVGGCHAAGAAGGTFTAAGTVYKLDGTTPNPGANIRINSGAMTFNAVADSAGNFRFTQTITYPATTDATACPDTTPMLGDIRAGEGACSQAGCHAVGSATGVIKFQ